MMRLKVYGEKLDDVTRLRLIQVSDDKIELQIVDIHGERQIQGGILNITPDGLVRNNCLHGGFPVDARGRIELNE